MKIVIDAMGGDHAPRCNVEGAIAAAIAFPDVQITLVGEQVLLESLLSECGGSHLTHICITHASQVIHSEDEPVKAVRSKKDASMVVAAEMVKQRAADAMISAGNTGALLAAGLFIIGRIPGIDRPALAPILPTVDDVGVLALDIGANMDGKPSHLLQYGQMGSIYRQKMHHIERPRVGLLNVGQEQGKGSERVKEAYRLLEQNVDITFIGNVEARDVLLGKCDVLVCDGFSGNILLKSIEGTAKTIFSLLKEQFHTSWTSKLAASILKPKLKAIKNKLDDTEHGGAPLLGLKGLVVKSHGSADAAAIKNAVRQARMALQQHLVHSISDQLTRK